MATEEVAIEGQRILRIRRMTDDEMRNEGWEHEIGDNPVVIVLENGVRMFPSRDPEGNGPGMIFGREDEESCFTLYVAP